MLRSVVHGARPTLLFLQTLVPHCCSPCASSLKLDRGRWQKEFRCHGSLSRLAWSVKKLKVDAARNRIRPRARPGNNNFDEAGPEDDSDDEDPVHASVDYLFLLARKGFYRVCRTGTKTARGWLPLVIPTPLISFTVGGIVLLTTLWVLKALLEVGCVAGTFIFGVIVAIRAVWSFVSYFTDLSDSSGSSVNGSSPDDKGRYRWSFPQPD